MDSFKAITPSTTVVKISSCLSVISKSIVEGRAKNIPEHSIKEVEFLRSQCKSDNVHLSLMSVQTFVFLVENGTMEVHQVLTMFISMLPNSSPSQYTSISEGIISLLLINLKRKTATLKPNEKFECPYGIKSQQHPIITLIQNNPGGMDDIANKINGICNHYDNQIKENCIEYLRPVFLYVLCNPQTLPNSKTIWTTLLSMSKSSEQAKTLILDIISWSRLSTPSTCLFTSILLIEAIEFHESNANFDQCIDLVIYQALVANNLIAQAVDPRPTFQCILRTLQATQKYSRHFYNILLILLSEILHSIPPTYLSDLIRIIHFIIVKENCGNQYIRNMSLDGVIQWMSQTGFIPPDALAMSDEIIKTITTTKGSEGIEKTSTEEILGSSSRNLHPDIALAFDVAHLIESFDDNDNIVAFVDSLSVKAKPAFCHKINLFLRAIFLSTEPSVDCWYKIYEMILSLIKSNEFLAFDFLMTYLFKLGKVTDPEVILELFRGLPSFAVSKDNIPMILNTLKSMKNGQNSPFLMDLYMKLWKVEGRTYPFLVKMIAEPFKVQDRMWDHQVAKNYVIREICYEKPTQYGRDLVSQISDTLNNCTTDEGDLATSLALDAIISLCESNTVSITSTWKAIGDKFRHETRPRSLKSLYNFFAHVPLLQSPTLDYEELVDEALAFLWSTIRHEETTEFTNQALHSMKHYEVGSLLQVRHIPVKFKHDLKEIVEFGGMDLMDMNLDYVPGECWVQLLQKIRPECGSAAADLVSHFISEEINAFRSGIYRLPEGRPEPKKLQGLYQQSALRAVVAYLINQSRYGDHVMEKLSVTSALRSISKTYSKPIPPLDWSFLQCFFHISFESRKYCILIAKNQVLISSSAKRLLENYVQSFEPNCFEEDLLLLLSILPELVNGICLNIIKGFTEKIADYCFKESQLNSFAEGCLFEKFLDSVRSVFASNFDIPEALDYFTLVVERYMDTMDFDSRLFERYTEVVATMSQNSINSLTSPANWVDISIPKLKKATLVRCYLVLYSTQIPNPLVWLNPIIDAFAVKTEDLLFFQRHFAITLHAFNDDKSSCAWLMEVMIQIQALLAESSNKEKLEKVFFLLDIFILAIEVLSGCGVLLGNIETIVSSKEKRFTIFPECLQVLCDRVFWKDNEAKIYEFLYRLFNNSVITEDYKEMIKKSIVCSRNKPYFENKAVWMKYVGLRK